MASVYLDIYIGDRALHNLAQARYDVTCALLAQHASVYSLPTSPVELSAEQRDILSDIAVIHESSPVRRTLNGCLER
jgi:hypothetical protein